MSMKIALERIWEAQRSNATKLILAGLGLIEIPKELSVLKGLKALNLSNNLLTEIKGLDQLTQLTELNLSYNQITEMKGLDKLTQLIELNLSHNKIIKINGLTKLSNLYKLDLLSNNIKKINGLEKLAVLIILYLSDNEISQVEGLENLSRLRILHLNKNQLKTTFRLGCLPQLRILWLQDNQLTEINDLKKLPLLEDLLLHNNQISEFPEFLLKLNIEFYWENDYKKRGVFLEKNPIRNLSPEIIKQGKKAIIEYFNQRKKAGDELLNEAKLILLGDGRSGKTSLANRLLRRELPKEEDRTQGVDIVIGEYSFPMANGKEFKINIWDFAGQDKYKTLHQLFYTESSLYVMVAESGKMTTDFDDWLQTAELFGEGSPLILVLNEFKDGIGSGSFDSSYWKKRFPDLLKEVFTVNLGTKQNFSTAEEFIRFLAQSLPHTKYAFPANWAAIRRVLSERRNEQYISLQEYLKICKENNLPERDSALILSSVLHKIGDCLHYQKSDLLKQLIILKNEWATDAVYKVLDDKIVSEEKCGFFNQADLKRIWSSAEYEDMRPQLLELMKQFRLAYQLPGKEEYVTPPLLPPARPKRFAWPEQDALELYIEYEFMPKALLTQFIVTRHADIADGRTLVWRHGVVLKWEGETLAEVSKTKLEGKDAFYIRVQGNNRKGMMTVILKTFRELHSEYKGIKYKEKVPCICEGCRTGKNSQHYFDFANLQFRLEKSRYEVECDQSLELVNVLELLENSFVFEQFEETLILRLKEKVLREHTSEIRILKLFLASSNELLVEREKIEQELNRKNNMLRKQGFHIELRIWEDRKHVGKSIRSQDDYNLEIKECNLFAMMFYSKVGKYTLEEFELAQSLFGDKGAPRICVFQKDINLPKNQQKEDANSRFDFMERLSNMAHFPILFDNPDKLVNELEDMIDKLLQDEDFVSTLMVE